MEHKRDSHSVLNRRELLKYGLYSGLAASLSSSLWLSGCAKWRGKKPNIVFILIDALRADHLPSYGYKIDTAPNIQRLTRQGVVFERVIAPSTWTKTSIASIMASCNPSRHGARGIKDVLPSQLTTIAEQLSTNGYRTVAVNTNPWLAPKFGFKAGFDIYRTLPINSSGPISERSFSLAWAVNHKAMEFLKECSQKEPVFLYLHYMDVHAPYRPRPPFFSAPALDVPGFGVLPNDKLEFIYRIKGLDAPGVRERVIELYDGEIRTVDAAVGKLLERLQKKGWLDNTIVVITSDHGEAFGEHGTVEHGVNLYPEVYEVPLILLWPGHLPAGVRIGVQVRSIDIAPTLLGLAGLTVPKSFDGEPLLPMEAGALEDRIAISAVGLNDGAPDSDYIAVVSREYLYVREKIKNIVEFYDLRSDPEAHNNLGQSHPEATFYAGFEDKDNAATRTSEQVELDEETREQLKSLGYLR